MFGLEERYSWDVLQLSGANATPTPEANHVGSNTQILTFNLCLDQQLFIRKHSYCIVSLLVFAELKNEKLVRKISLICIG